MEDCWILSIIFSCIIGLFILFKGLGKLGLYLIRRTDFSKWANTPRDVVILHTIRGKTIPSPSPFALKLETFLRMANIPHEVDTDGKAGPKQKTPWITLNGEHIGDSQIIIEFLTKKYAVELNGKYSKEALASGLFLRTACDEHLVWAMVIWRWSTQDGLNTIKDLLSVPPMLLWLYKKFAPSGIKKMAWAQGMGRHSKEEIYEIVKNELGAISDFLGEKEFILGEEPSPDDCAIFGLLAQFVWATPGSPYEHFFKDEYKNLGEYCERMKERFWKDWDNVLIK